MDLRNNQITIKELYNNVTAALILEKHIPLLINSNIFFLYPNMTLENLFRYFIGRVSQEHFEMIIRELEQI
jgi:hypothetical protein